MSARPRLVEEGTPIGGARESTNNEDMMDAGTQRRSSSSSLARAAGGSSTIPDDSPKTVKRKPYRLTTRLVIGGEQQEEEHDSMVIDSHDHHHHQATHYHHHHSHAYAHHHVPPKPTASHHYVIGGQQNHSQAPVSHHYVIGNEYDDDRVLERMEGVEDHGSKGPLVVMDGANIAYAYADVMARLDEGSSLGAKLKNEPDARGIAVAAKYFLTAGIRVLVVIPTPWLRAKPRAGDTTKDNALMLTPQLEVLQDLKTRGLLVSAPPKDDDDAYCLLIARREDSRAKKRGEGGGFVLSNDMFRDAVQRDTDGELRSWLKEGTGNGPGRISFAFCDMGNMDDHGEREMDFIPNPRHELVIWIESHHRSNNLSTA